MITVLGIIVGIGIVMGIRSEFKEQRRMGRMAQEFKVRGRKA